jgi:uncharacterized membrane protein YphA (DoxX/SURF4 family)
MTAADSTTGCQQQHRRWRRTRTWLVAMPCLLAFLPASAVAHERWFVEGEHPPTDWSDLWSLPVALALCSAIGVVALLWWGQRTLGDPLWPRPGFSQRLEPAAPAILAVQTAITMIYAATQLTLFVPNIELPRSATGFALAGLAIVAGFSFITGVLTRAGALLTVALVLAAFAYAPADQVAEQVIFVGIALYLVAVGRGVIRFDGTEEDRTSLSDRLLPHALTILRVSAAASILILAFTEKLLNVELGEAFLQNYPKFNVAHDLGFEWFTDERFVYAAGIVEATAGAALLCGFLPRVVILGLWIPFNLGIAFLPPTELIGHLPILSTMYVLLVRGTEGIPPPQVDQQPAPPQRSASHAAAASGAR